MYFKEIYKIYSTKNYAQTVIQDAEEKFREYSLALSKVYLLEQT